MTSLNIKISPQTKVIIDQICQPQILDSLISAKEPTIHVDTLSALSELVNIYIRDMLRSGEYNHEIHIKKATEKAKAALKNQLSLNSEPIKSKRILSVFDSYLKIINESLAKKPSQNKKSFKEYLKELIREDPYFKDKSLQVDEDKQFNELVKHLEFESYYNLPEEIILNLIKVSFNGFTEGLLIYPILDDLDELSINLEDLSDGFQLLREQDSFPWEIVFEEFLFILDDDGTIFTYVETFTHDLFLQAGKLLIDLAIQIYSDAYYP